MRFALKGASYYKDKAIILADLKIAANLDIDLNIDCNLLISKVLRISIHIDTFYLIYKGKDRLTIALSLRLVDF